MLTVTEMAGSRLKNIIQEQDIEAEGIRVFIRGRCGCGAVHYGMGFESQVDNEDQVIESYGIRVIMDQEAASELDEAQVDYVETPTSSGFTINNPNASGCACGH